MAVKPHGVKCVVAEQIIEDLASGLTIQVEHMHDGQWRMVVQGDLPFGNREFIFDQHGALGGAGTFTGSICKPTWLRLVD